MKRFWCVFVTLFVCCFFETVMAAPVVQKTKDGKTELIMSGIDAVKMAGRLIDIGDYDNASQILTKMPQTDNLDVEIERWYLIAQIAQHRGDINTAIKIYQKILDDQPNLVKIRYELALCYMANEQWYRADYNLRLAMAGDNIPEDVKRRMMYYRYLVRKNKNWNVWFNFGVAPDNNINLASGGEECVTNQYGVFCRQLQEPETVVGKNFTFGANYEFKLTDDLRWKNEGLIYTNVYDKHKYDDLYLSASTGPRYVFNNGDIWLAGIVNRRWYGWNRYNWAYGGKLDINYDLTRKLSSGLSLRILNNLYDEYGEWLNGQTYSVLPRLVYSLDATKYFVLRGNLERETAKLDVYANRKYGIGVGFGTELPYGFHLYIEPGFFWVKYDGDRWVAKDDVWKPVQENDFMQRYTVSLSNNKLEFFGFVPAITCSYTKKDSNIHSREYEKFITEFTFQQRF